MSTIATFIKRATRSMAFSGEVGNREKLADMLSSGSISNDAELIIEHGNCWVNVRIFGHGDEGDYIEVEAWRK